MKTAHVQMFGHFRISIWEEGKEVKAMEEDDFHSPSVVNLLAYILKNHTKHISAQELIENIFQDDESDNPAGTLKNLIYRLRTLLKKLGSDDNYIVTGKKAYYWNPEIPPEIDTDLFDRYFQNGKDTKETAARKENFWKAFELYKSRFLPRHEEQYWVVCASAAYESCYHTLTRELCIAFEKDQEYDKMEQVASAALQQDNLSEENHCYFIRALIGQDKMTQALDHYHAAEELLYNNLALESTDELQKLWPRLMEQIQSEKENIKSIESDLMDDYQAGAFYCDYGVFKKIYQLELRRADRLGVSVYMSLMTIGFRPESGIELEEQNETLVEKMLNLKNILLASLRSGDVITRYSKSQFIVLLPTCQYETAHKVMERVKRNYEKRFGSENIKLECSFDAL